MKKYLYILPLFLFSCITKNYTTNNYYNKPAENSFILETLKPVYNPMPLLKNIDPGFGVELPAVNDKFFQLNVRDSSLILGWKYNSEIFKRPLK